MEKESIKLKLGVIGLSHGNGHPFSWSAICNGWNYNVLEDCIFTAFDYLAKSNPRLTEAHRFANSSVTKNIMSYLSKQDPRHDTVSQLEVSHVWAQDIRLSELIAKGTGIPHIVTNAEQMIPHVDGILLARDDAELHLEMAKPFIEAGLPIFIDKPLAYAMNDALEIYKLERYPGQIFTCSSVTYGKEFQSLPGSINMITKISAHVMKDWQKYGIHIIEPMVNLMGLESAVIKAINKQIDGDTHQVDIKWDSGLLTSITAHGMAAKQPIEMFVYGRNEKYRLVFADSYYAFKKTLETFRDIMMGRIPNNTKERTLKVMEIIQNGA